MSHNTPSHEMRQEVGSLRFLKVTGAITKEKPFVSSVPFLASGSRMSNFEEEEEKVKISDVRGREDEYTLDKNGFQYLKYSFNNLPETKVEGPGHPFLTEVIKLFRDLLGAKEIVVYDCNVTSKACRVFVQANVP